jgi:hypothetical protein
LVIYGARLLAGVPGLGGIIEEIGQDYRGRPNVRGDSMAAPKTVTPRTSSPRRLTIESSIRALKTPVRPVMVPLQRLPFRDFTAEEFLGGDVVSRKQGRWISIFNGSTLTLGQMADAFVYFGRP